MIERPTVVLVWLYQMLVWGSLGLPGYWVYYVLPGERNSCGEMVWGGANSDDDVQVSVSGDVVVMMYRCLYVEMWW